ncbi:MAG: bifunctional folylpolyglutamate synthase/dihydrofolate synthase, partial [Duncaniella sp.]|nr:bifunctional folylpolyglutamate synthase/dihydrofolate synthase [Duncaniella sp.]
MFTSYQEAIDYLYRQLPTFHREGPGAYKPGLDTARALDSLFGNPSEKITTVHIAGTNGKGSTAHSLAAILQKAGYRTGLYTSPHIVDFRERIRIDGLMIPEDDVVDFVNRYITAAAGIEPSFFELTTIMAFDYFARSGVDVAVIETGLGGRLDTTNIISPLLSVITNISPDHTSLLGDTPAAIAAEKAGIIKPGVPVVIGRADDESVRKVFTETAARNGSPIIFAQPLDAVAETDGIVYRDTPYGTFKGELAGIYQIENTATILAAVAELSRRLDIPAEAVTGGLTEVSELTGLRGRWTKLADNPATVYDTGHNPGGWEQITAQLSKLAPRHIHLV